MNVFLQNFEECYMKAWYVLSDYMKLKTVKSMKVTNSMVQSYKNNFKERIGMESLKVAEQGKNDTTTDCHPYIF